MLEVTTIGIHAGNKGFIFYQDGTPAHTAQDWLQANRPG